ncbi:MAG: hypothetical protein AB7R90_03920 [Reyranellaceae bacterium]
MTLRLAFLLPALTLLLAPAASAQEWELHMKPKPGQQPAPAPAPAAPSQPQAPSGWNLHMKPGSAAPSADERIKANSPRALAAALENSAWDGALFPRNRPPIRLSIAFRSPRGVAPNALLAVSLRADTAAWREEKPYYAFTLTPDGDMRIASVASAGSSTWFATVFRETYIEAFDRTVLRLGTGEGVAFLTRRTDGDQRSQIERCAAHDRWLAERQAAWTIARELKIDFAAGLSQLDEARASLAAAFDPAAFAARFGTGLDAIDEAGFKRLMLEFFDCAVSSAEMPRQELLAGMIDASLAMRQRGGFFADSARRPVMPDQPLATLQQAREIALATREAEQELPALIARAGTEAALALQAKRLSQVRPAILKTALAELKARTVAQRKEDGDRRAAERQRRAAERMRGVRFPDGAIAAIRAPMMRQLVAGRLTRVQGEELSYVGGFAEWSVAQCGIPASAGDRLMLLALIDPARQRAAAGGDYSNPNPGGSVGSAARNQAAYLDGAATAKAISCRDPFLGAALASMVELASSMKQDSEGNASLFERSCRLDRSASDCACVLQVGQASMPDIADQRYSRGLVAELIQRNPFTGFKLAGCGVTRY